MSRIQLSMPAITVESDATEDDVLLRVEVPFVRIVGDPTSAAARAALGVLHRLRRDLNDAVERAGGGLVVDVGEVGDAGGPPPDPGPPG